MPTIEYAYQMIYVNLVLSNVKGVAIFVVIVVVKILITVATLIFELNRTELLVLYRKVFPDNGIKILDTKPQKLPKENITDIAERTFGRLISCVFAPVIIIQLVLAMRYGVNADYFPMKLLT
jgi:hypothetical protein